MKIFIDPKFMERVVFERSRQEPHLEAHYGYEFAACFEVREPAQREQAFATLHQKWFECFGFRAMLLAALSEFPLISKEVERCIVDGAPKPQLQEAELRGDAGNYTLLLRLHSQTLLDTWAFQRYARQELMHIEDILDPAFEHNREVTPSGWSMASKNSHRERYALLWTLSIDERLHQRHGPRHPLSTHRVKELSKSFQLESADKAEALIKKLSDAGVLQHPTHRNLLDWAGDGHQGTTEAMRSESAKPSLNGLHPGSPCPLCRFPTFDWTPEISGSVMIAIQADFPQWEPVQGACGRCMELYRSRANADRPTRCVLNYEC